MPAGDHVIHCTEIQSVDEDITFEGLWVFVSDQPSEDIDAWMTQLEYMNRERNYEGVGFQKARQAGEGRLLSGQLRANQRGREHSREVGGWGQGHGRSPWLGGRVFCGSGRCRRADCTSAPAKPTIEGPVERG